MNILTKRIKGIAAALLAFALVAGLGAPVLAASTPRYVTTIGDTNVKVGRASTKTYTDYASITVKPVDKNTHYIEEKNIVITPAENYGEYTYNPSTGELFITGLTGDVSVSVRATEKSVASKIAVKKVTFNSNGLYSEANPAIQTEIQVEVTDQFGAGVPSTKVYFKPDESEVSFSNARETDEKGLATFKYSFAISREKGDIRADYKPLFALDREFTGIKTDTDIHLVLQQRKDLVLFTNQLTGSKPGENEGKVTGLPEGYEVFTGTVHQGALVKDTGVWSKGINGEVTGLGVGQHAIRFAEKVDESTNTFYFASNVDYFFIERIEHQVKTEEKAEEVKPEDKEPVAESPKPANKEPVAEETRPENASPAAEVLGREFANTEAAQSVKTTATKQLVTSQTAIASIGQQKEEVLGIQITEPKVQAKAETGAAISNQESAPQENNALIWIAVGAVVVLAGAGTAVTLKIRGRRS